MINDSRVVFWVFVISFMITIWATSQIAYADSLTHKFKSPSFNGVGTSAHYLTIENQEKTRKDAIAQERKTEEEKRIAAAKNTNYAKFIKNLESRIYARFSKELEEAVFGEACGTTFDTTTKSGVDYTGGTANSPPAQVVEGQTAVGGDCTGTITFNDTTMTWKKIVTVDDPYVELIIDGPDGGQTINMPLNDLRF